MVTHSGRVLSVNRDLLKQLLFRPDLEPLDTKSRRHVLISYLREQLRHEHTQRSPATWDWEHDLPVLVDEIEFRIDNEALALVAEQCSNARNRRDCQTEVFAEAIKGALRYMIETVASARPQKMSQACAFNSDPQQTLPRPIAQVLEKKILLLERFFVPVIQHPQ